MDKKDTKTLSYTVNPKYETQTIYCVTVPCPQGKTVVIGYEVTQTIQIKVRKVDIAGDVVGEIGAVNITEISGPEFTVDDMDKVNADAKEIAIKNAKEKAKATAKALGVDLGSIMQFSEDNGGYYPMYYKTDAVSSMSGGATRESATLPQGESVIKSRVSITYSLD